MSCLDVMYQVYGPPQPYFAAAYTPYHQVRVSPARVLGEDGRHRSEHRLCPRSAAPSRSARASGPRAPPGCGNSGAATRWVELTPLPCPFTLGTAAKALPMRAPSFPGINRRGSHGLDCLLRVCRTPDSSVRVQGDESKGHSGKTKLPSER